MESNHFTSLSDIAPITDLNKLKTLILNFNSISKVFSENQKEPLMFGRSLNRVELAFNEIGDWEFINQLPAVIPGLDNLRISHNPLYDKSGFRSADDGYLLTIARISKLTKLNYTPV
jgi:Leucine-rich repeat (LRR) protein